MSWRSYRYAKYRRRHSRWRRVLGFGSWVAWSVRLLVLFLVVDAFYVSAIWPDWQALAAGPVPKSNFIKQYEQDYRKHRWPHPHWYPVVYQVIPDYMQRAVVVAEDSRFWQHSGFDLIAFKEAMDYNLSEQRMAFGASTISQQTVKNLFLSASRNPLRKWHELLLTWGMEKNLGKKRILEIYLNIAEFGRGIYGVEAAARHYWGIKADHLSVAQAIELAAALPNPVRDNPHTRTDAFIRRIDKITGWYTAFFEQYAR